ncbi:hypothetical protein [Crocosphaera sp. Alani8]|uniref:hypothetical protein n=1 Tax=Crocosphaera sp. Alani8 TaxID=3038952 RepID=UPI00313E405B
MKIKPVGGRGQKAPYKTRVMRVPEPIAEQVQALIDEYRLSIMSDKVEDKDSFIIIKISQLNSLFSSILRQRKSAKVSFEKLEDKLVKLYSLFKHTN